LLQSKAVPEELKKKYEELVKQLNDTIKGLNSPEVNAKAQKLQETLTTSVKKIGEQVMDLSKSFGLAIPPTMSKAFSEILEEVNKSSKALAVRGRQK